MVASHIDVLIRSAKVVDGTGNPWFYGDIALSGDRIVDVAEEGRISPDCAREVIDAMGMVVCPGFIDIQSHSIGPLMTDGRSVSKITQGVTTEVMGETWTPAPFGGKAAGVPEGWRDRARKWHRFADWLEAMVEHGVSPNIGSFLSGGTLRSYARGLKTGPATVDELDTMRRVMDESMQDGAFGVSYALIYPPDTYVSTDEIVEICKVVSRHGGVYITHMRSEGAGLIEGVEEALEIGRRADLPVEIYHLKATEKQNWQKMPQAIAMIDAARALGVDVTANMYPYTASGTGLEVVLPSWLSADGKFFENLREPKLRQRIRHEAEQGESESVARSPGPENIMPIGLRLPEHAEYVGLRLNEIAVMRGQDWIDTVLDLLIAEEQRISTIFFMMSEENIKLKLIQPWIKISTDAGGYDPAWAAERGPVHPRSYGTYPRVLGTYVRDTGILALEDAIRKMTSAVANRLGLRERGRLHAGCYADVAIFDPRTIADRATFVDSHQLSIGVCDVWVNGIRVLANGTHTGATPGRIVNGPGSA